MSMPPRILVHCPKRTARHEAAFTWTLGSALGLAWAWADTASQPASSDDVHLFYGVDGEAGVRFPAEGLLSEVGQRRSEPPATEGEDADLLAAIFWMGSRMEEFGAGASVDDHGRFDPTGSPAELRGWLERPICEEWAFQVGERLLGERWDEHRRHLEAQFEVVPTLDVDSAYAFRGKGLWRTTAALLRDIITGRFSTVLRRLQVILGREADPYDTYAQAAAWHAERGLEARWFFLLAAFGPHDKGLPSSSPALGELMRSLERDPRCAVGWHPGYAAAENAEALSAEAMAFERILGRRPVASRQHYLRMNPTQTRRHLLALGIREDHTEGHAVRTGFRGGFARSRPWYDLEAEALTDLLLCPFAAMDATYARYLKTPPEEVPERVGELAAAVRKVGGPLRLLWHNESLAPEGLWKNWGGVYPAVLDAALESPKAP